MRRNINRNRFIITSMIELVDENTKTVIITVVYMYNNVANA